MRPDRRVMLGGGVLILVLAAAYLLGVPDGAALFQREGCIQCHSIGGRGGSLGPDLTAVAQRRSRGWIRQQIRNPRKHNPNSAMPSFDHLSWLEVEALVRYLSTEGGRD